MNQNHQTDPRTTKTPSSQTPNEHPVGTTDEHQSEPTITKIDCSTHLGITIRWGVEAAAPASTTTAGGAPC